MSSAWKKMMAMGVAFLVLVVGAGSVSAEEAVDCAQNPNHEDCISVESPDEGECTSILPPDWCGDNGEDAKSGVSEILQLVLNILTGGVGVLATVGLVVSGIQWMTARDNEAQVVKAKSRIFNIVIGLIVWGVMWLVLTWLMPGGVTLDIP